MNLHKSEKDLCQGHRKQAHDALTFWNKNAIFSVFLIDGAVEDCND